MGVELFEPTSERLKKLVGNPFVDADIAVGANINANKIGTGVVDNTEFNRLNGITSALEEQGNKGAVSGYAGLDASQELLLANFPSGTGLQVLRRNAGNTALEFAAAAAGLPVVDTTSIAKGSVDATKEVRFEVDGNTTGIIGVIATIFTTAKTVTLPDATDTLMGKATTDVMTNKSYDLGGVGNVLTGSVAEFNTALQADTFAFISNNLSVFAATTSAQLAGVISDETGTGLLVFGTSPTLITPALGTPSALVLTNATGLPIATGLLVGTSADLAGRISDETGTGLLVFNNTPTLLTPTIADFTNATHTHLNAAGGGTITVPAISGTKAEFDVALTDDNFAYIGQDNVFTLNQEIRRTGATPVFTLDRPEIVADGVIIGRFNFTGFDDASVGETYAQIRGAVESDVAANPKGSLELRIDESGILTSYIGMNVNGGVDIDLLKPVNFNSQTGTNLSLALGSNTVTGTKAEFDTALSDDNFPYLAVTNIFTADNSFVKPTGSPMTLTLRRDEATTGIGGQITFQAKNSDGAQGIQIISTIVARLSDTTEAGADGRLLFQITEAGTEGVNYLELDGGNARVECFKDFALTATKKFFLDGGGDTSIRESVANTMIFEAGGNDIMQINNTNVALKDGAKLILDGFTGQESIFSPASNKLELDVGTKQGLLMHKIGNAVSFVPCFPVINGTSETQNHFFIPFVQGVPTGVPTANTGKSAITYDETTKKLMVFDVAANAWKGVAVA